MAHTPQIAGLTRDDVLAKFENCTAIFSQASGRQLPILLRAGTLPEVRGWLQGADANPARLRAAGAR